MLTQMKKLGRLMFVAGWVLLGIAGISQVWAVWKLHAGVGIDEVLMLQLPLFAVCLLLGFVLAKAGTRLEIRGRL